ncbi:unnamed protein product [Caenorhabditis auriculariae]|uniref:Uncharacterized protein n=1 Tax=Caenorhabditis auriculariae TaxID=2777116 RepID=A0A8S1H9J7_9PELO|nr:unnamed protein product [Caenorhabditis auriculariae]
MSSTSYIGGAILALLLAGYIAQRYGLPPPAPKIAGVDLGTTYSSIGIYHAVTGETTIIPDDLGKKSVPSVVAFLPNGTVLIGTRAVEQQEKNPRRTIYDAKRFIGRTFEANNADFLADQKRYPFVIKLDDSGRAYFMVLLDTGDKRRRKKHVKSALNQVVISVPAEFGEKQRNFTGKAAELAGMEVRRVISEPTAAALAYGLHKKTGVESVVVVDLGGGTLDVSAMAGNNRLGGQDFNDRVQRHIIKKLEEKFGKTITDKEDLQQIRMDIEKAKIRLTSVPKAMISLKLKAVGEWSYELTREEFEQLNDDLLRAIEKPIEAALADANLKPEDVDEIVLVGGSTQVPAVRKIVGRYFRKSPNFGIDPELAVVTGASVQAGVIGGGWPLQVAAMELPTKKRKRHFFTEEQKKNEQDKEI